MIKEKIKIDIPKFILAYFAERVVNLFFILCFFFPFEVFAQDSVTNPLFEHPDFYTSFIYKTNPAAILWGAIPLTSEYGLIGEVALSRRTALQVGGAYLGKNIFWLMLEDSAKSKTTYGTKLSVNGYSFSGAFKFYYFPNAPLGGYVSPHVSYSSARFYYLNYNRVNDYLLNNRYIFSLMFGRQMLWFRRVFVDMYVGIGYKTSEWIEGSRLAVHRTSSPLGDFDENKFKLNMGFNLGFTLD